MSVVSLILLLIFAPDGSQAGATQFVLGLKAMGPQALQVSEDLGPPTRRARLEVDAEGALRLTWGEGPGEMFRFDPNQSPPDAWAEAREQPESPFDQICRGAGTENRLEIGCWSASDLRAANLRPPAVTYVFESTADGVRVVRTTGGGGERMVFTSAGRTPQRPRGVGPGTPAVLADALAQLAAFEGGRMYGGSSGGGDWYGSDLIVSGVRGLDFRIERTVAPDRGGRSHMVPARWSFDHQGPSGGDNQSMAWLMVMTRDEEAPREFWCVGRPKETSVLIACRAGRTAWTGPSEPVAFRLTPYPEWRIHVTEGLHSGFSTAGTSRLKTRPYP